MKSDLSDYFFFMLLITWRILYEKKDPFTDTVFYNPACLIVQKIL